MEAFWMSGTKGEKLELDEYGNYPCPYCNNILTPILREWMPAITDYICHHCQKGFRIRKTISLRWEGVELK